MNISDEWETPEKQPFKDFVRASPDWKHYSMFDVILSLKLNACPRFIQGNMRHWIEDQDCRDQYSVIYESGERTAIFSNDAKEPIVVEERAVSSPTLIN